MADIEIKDAPARVTLLGTDKAILEPLAGLPNEYATLTQIAAFALASDADIAAIAALTTTAYGRSVLSAADAAALRTLAGLIIGTNVQAFHANLTTFAGIAPSANVQSLLAAANYAAFRQLLNVPRVVAQLGTASSWTGTTAQTTLATITVPGGSLGPNGALEIITLWSFTVNANSKTMRITIGGVDYLSRAETAATATGSRFFTSIFNNNSASAQKSHGNTSTTFGSSVVAPATSAVNTAADFAITISGQLANGADTITLEAYTVKTIYGA